MTAALRLRTLTALAAALWLAPSCASSGSAAGAGAEERFASGSGRAPSAATLRSVARVMAAQGKDEQCEMLLQRLVRDYPSFAPAYGELAELYLRTERVESAVAALELGLARAPQDPVLRNNLGMCRLVQRDYEAALAEFTAAAGADPADARNRCNMALALGMLGRTDEALALYLQSIGEADAHHNLGLIHELRGEAEAAAREFALSESM
jgi:Flp pilus assembly protein TadD